jgi:folate-binding protein YgfZ
MRQAVLDTDRLTRLLHAAVLVRTTPAAFQVAGTGALTCLQGLLTNDLAAPGEYSVVYGALLTPKGAIVVDYWVLRLPDRFLLLAEPAGHDASLDLFRRSLPPRLAKVDDHTGRMDAVWLYGAAVPASLARAGHRLPEPGRVLSQEDLLLARPHAAAPFQALLIGPTEEMASVLPRLTQAGIAEGTVDERAAAGILAGWPELGAEIDERTLVQEVRYDDIGGVSYTKGCYTGQETVARLHFRGHANRELKGLAWIGAGRPGGAPVTDLDGKELGAVSSMLSLPERALGLGLLRRTVPAGSTVLAGGTPATVVPLPFDPGHLAAG